MYAMKVTTIETQNKTGTNATKDQKKSSLTPMPTSSPKDSTNRNHCGREVVGAANTQIHVAGRARKCVSRLQSRYARTTVRALERFKGRNQSASIASRHIGSEPELR